MSNEHFIPVFLPALKFDVGDQQHFPIHSASKNSSAQEKLVEKNQSDRLRIKKQIWNKIAMENKTFHERRRQQFLYKDLYTRTRGNLLALIEVRLSNKK